jgi:hypothetical protein
MTGLTILQDFDWFGCFLSMPSLVSMQSSDDAFARTKKAETEQTETNQVTKLLKQCPDLSHEQARLEQTSTRFCFFSAIKTWPMVASAAS